MSSRITILGTLILIAALLGWVSDRSHTRAAEYSCKTTQCPNLAKCEGDHWTKTGDCSISCYKESGVPGEIVFSGSANCGTSSGAGLGGSSLFGTLLPGDNAYCRDNWWWDAGCAGPNDSYSPPGI